MTEPVLKPGDVVTLKCSDEQPMVVCSIENNLAHCAWIAGDGSYHEASVPLVALFKANPTAPRPRRT